jgi:hypothetical protein
MTLESTFFDRDISTKPLDEEGGFSFSGSFKQTFSSCLFAQKPPSNEGNVSQPFASLLQTLTACLHFFLQNHPYRAHFAYAVCQL